MCHAENRNQQFILTVHCCLWKRHKSLLCVMQKTGTNNLCSLCSVAFGSGQNPYYVSSRKQETTNYTHCALLLMEAAILIAVGHKAGSVDGILAKILARCERSRGRGGEVNVKVDGVCCRVGI